MVFLIPYNACCPQNDQTHLKNLAACFKTLDVCLTFLWTPGVIGLWKAHNTLNTGPTEWSNTFKQHYNIMHERVKGLILGTSLFKK